MHHSVIGYHTCDQSVYDTVVKQEESLVAGGKGLPNDHLWLGTAIYFFENCEAHALVWAKKPYSRIKNPAVIAAKIDLGHCLDLAYERHNQELALAYAQLTADLRNRGKTFPKNWPSKEEANAHAQTNKAEAGQAVLQVGNVYRLLDCAVFNMLHTMRDDNGRAAYDTIRKAFQEGRPVYPGACIGEDDHITIAVRNPECIEIINHT